MDDEELLDLIGDEELVGDELDELLNLSAIAGIDLVGDDDYLGDDDDDYLGDDDDYLGDEDDDEVGARRRRRRRRRLRSRRRRGALSRLRRKLASRARTQRALSQGKAAVKTQSNRGRVLFLAGEAVQGGTAGQLLISTTAQELCRVDRLFITGVDDAGVPLAPASYRIADIKVGTKSQFSALPPLPGIMFQADATGMGAMLQLDTVQPGTDFTVSIADAPAGSRFNWGALATALR